MFTKLSIFVVELIIVSFLLFITFYNFSFKVIYASHPSSIHPDLKPPRASRTHPNRAEGVNIEVWILKSVRSELKPTSNFAGMQVIISLITPGMDAISLLIGTGDLISFVMKPLCFMKWIFFKSFQVEVPGRSYLL